MNVLGALRVAITAHGVTSFGRLAILERFQTKTPAAFASLNVELILQVELLLVSVLSPATQQNHSVLKRNTDTVHKYSPPQH